MTEIPAELEHPDESVSSSNSSSPDYRMTPIASYFRRRGQKAGGNPLAVIVATPERSWSGRTGFERQRTTSHHESIQFLGFTPRRLMRSRRLSRTFDW